MTELRPTFRPGPNGEKIRTPDAGSGWGRVDYLTEGRAWPSPLEQVLKRLGEQYPLRDFHVVTAGDQHFGDLQLEQERQEAESLASAVRAVLRDKVIDDDETRAGVWFPYEHLERVEKALMREAGSPSSEFQTYVVIYTDVMGCLSVFYARAECVDGALASFFAVNRNARKRCVKDVAVVCEPGGINSQTADWSR